MGANYDELIQGYINQEKLILMDTTLNCTGFLRCDECCLNFHKDDAVTYGNIEVTYSNVRPKCVLMREIFMAINYPELIV